MRHRAACVAPDQKVGPEMILRCVGNLIVIAVLPFRLGQMGAPWWFLPIYAVIAGLLMTVTEDIRFARGIILRRDVRTYAQVRVALITVLGTLPFGAGMGLAL